MNSLNCWRKLYLITLYSANTGMLPEDCTDFSAQSFNVTCWFGEGTENKLEAVSVTLLILFPLLTLSPDTNDPLVPYWLFLATDMLFKHCG